MESKEQRQVKRGFGIFRKAIAKRYGAPTEQQKDQVWRTDIRARQRAQAAVSGCDADVYTAGSIERLKALRPAPNQAMQEYQKEVIGPYSEWYKEDQKVKAQKAEEARKQQEFQTSDFYKINLAAIYGYGTLGLTPSSTGLRYVEEIKKMDTKVLHDAVSRLRKGGDELKGYPLGTGGYGKEYVNEFINWLLAEIVSRGEPTEAPATDNEKSTLDKLKQVVDLFRGH